MKLLILMVNLEVNIEDKLYSPEELSAMILTKMKKNC